MPFTIPDTAHTPSITIVIDVFSGRENPKWTPTAAQKEEIVRDLAATAPVASVENREEPLGFRGFFIVFDTAEGRRSLHVHNGLIRSGNQCHADDGGKLETLIVRTMPADLKSEFHDVLSSE